MKELFSDDFMKKGWISKGPYIILFYAISFPSVIIAHQVAPASLAGPGLDWYVYPIAIICSYIFLYRNFLQAKQDKSFWMPFLMHLIGLAGLIGTMFIP